MFVQKWCFSYLEKCIFFWANHVCFGAHFQNCAKLVLHTFRRGPPPPSKVCETPRKGRTLAEEALSYSTIYPSWVQRTQVGLWPSQHIGWPSGLRPSAIKILTLPALLAVGGYVLPFGSNKSLILLKPTCILDGRPHYTATSCPTALYPTPPSILILVTWVQHTQAGLRPSLHVGWPSGVWPLAIKILTRLRSILRAEQESYSIETHLYP